MMLATGKLPAVGDGSWPVTVSRSQAPNGR